MKNLIFYTTLSLSFLLVISSCSKSDSENSQIETETSGSFQINGKNYELLPPEYQVEGSWEDGRGDFNISFEYKLQSGYKEFETLTFLFRKNTFPQKGDDLAKMSLVLSINDNFDNFVFQSGGPSFPYVSGSALITDMNPKKGQISIKITNLKFQCTDVNGQSLILTFNGNVKTRFRWDS